MENALHELQEQLDEAHAAIIREKEAAKIAIAQAPPVIKEVPVVDNTKLKLLENHNEELEVKARNLSSDCFLSVCIYTALKITHTHHKDELITLNWNMKGELRELKLKIEEFEKRYSEVENESMTRLKEAEEAQLKTTLLQETIERLPTTNMLDKHL